MLVLPHVALLVAFAQQADPQAAGLRALDQQNYQQAEEFFSKAAAADPQDYAARFNLALAESGLKQDGKAMDLYREVLKLKPGLYAAELNLGMLLVREHKPEEAVPLLEDAAKQKADAARPKRYLGDALLANGDAEKAAAAYQAALKIDPKIAAAELGLGQALAALGKLDEAAPHYRAAAALEGGLKSYLLELAAKYGVANRPADALPLLLEFPGDPGAREEAGRLYLQTNQPANAVTQFQAAVELSPTPANRLALATAYLKNNQPTQAEPILAEALAKNPDDFDLRMAIGRIERDKRNYPVAAGHFLMAAKLKPEDASAWNEAATSLLMANQYQQALAALDRVRALHAETPGDFYFRALILDKLHQVKPALASYQQFLAVSQGKFPDQEFIARQRSKTLERQASR